MKTTKRTILQTLTAVTVWMLLAPAHAQLARSTFDADTDGWMVVDRANDSLTVFNTRSPVFTNWGGNPNGCIYTTDGPGDFYFRAPAKFLGNKSAAYGYPLEFDLISNLADTPGNLLYSVILIGGGLTNLAALPPITVSNTWTPFSVMLQAGAYWTNAATGLPSTAADLLNCLTALESLEISGEFGTGPDTGGIDNVTLFGPGTMVVWDRNARGQTNPCPAGGVYFWPNNYKWSQSDVWGKPCAEYGLLRTQPSNWTTTNYPDGPSYDVILGNSGGAPTYLDVSATLHSLTILPDGGLTLGQATLTANIFDLQCDGSIPFVGAVGAKIKIADGGSMTKSAGSGVLEWEPFRASLTGSGATISVHSGTLSLPTTQGSVSRWTNFAFFAAANTTLILLSTNNSYAEVDLYGSFTGSGSGAVLLGSGKVQCPSTGVTFDFPGPMFQWTGGTIDGQPLTNLGTINISGSRGKTLLAALNNTGTLNYDGWGSFTVDTLNGGLIKNLAEGTVNLQGDGNIAANGGAPISNWGTLRKSAGTGTFAVAKGFNNQNGSIEVSSGTLSIAGNYNQGSGALTFGIGGRGAGECGKLSVAGTATLGGPLNVFLTNGFALATGDRFQILSCGTRSGTFSTANLPAGTSLEHSGTGVFLMATGALPVVITSPTLSNGVAMFPFNTLSGQSYTVERNNDVSTTNWVFHTNFTGSGSLMQFAVPVADATQRFFRVRQP
jgi:hypothetical protein